VIHFGDLKTDLHTDLQVGKSGAYPDDKVHSL
jgi:hypothetical protein